MIIKRIFKNEKGQALVELAFILPIVLLILMGIIEFGRIFNSYLIITNASREGARYAALHSSDNEILNSINNLTKTLDNTKISISIYPSAYYRTSGTPVSVKIYYDVDIITPFINKIIPDPFRISSETTMRAE